VVLAFSLEYGKCRLEKWEMATGVSGFELGHWKHSLLDNDKHDTRILSFSHHF
jgi:hypothetical protein